MKYLVIGAGGTGGPIGGFMNRAGLDVTLIARGAHLKAMLENGLTFHTPDGEFTTNVKACTMEDYNDTPDVIFVCVKGYSLDDCVPFIKRVAGEKTVVIPILNIYGTGAKLQEQLPELTVTDGCIYIASQIEEPGTLLMLGKIFRVVYGFRKDTDQAVIDEYMPVLKKIEEDLTKSSITPLLSSKIEVDALQKFSFVSPMAASGAYYDKVSEAFQVPGEYRDTFISLVKEVETLSHAMNASLPADIVDINMKILDDLAPTSSASMHRDIRAGKSSEIDGLVYEVVRLGEKYNIPTPTYSMIAKEMKSRLV